MEIKVHGKHNHISDSLERFAEEKVSRLTRYYSPVETIDVELYEEGKIKEASHIAEVTVTTNGPLFRAKSAAADRKAAIDIAVDRLARQMSDYKRKQLKKPAHARRAKEPVPLDLSELALAEGAETP